MIVNFIGSLMTPQNPQVFRTVAGYISGAQSLHFSFAQWQYHSLWGSTEAWLLLIENLSQYPVMTTWNTVGFTIFEGHYGDHKNVKIKTEMVILNTFLLSHTQVISVHHVIWVWDCLLVLYLPTYM